MKKTVKMNTFIAKLQSQWDSTMYITILKSSHHCCRNMLCSLTLILYCFSEVLIDNLQFCKLVWFYILSNPYGLVLAADFSVARLDFSRQTT